MEKRLLGTSGLEVPVIGMGTWRTFDVSGKNAEANARSVVDQALAVGANFFDSSPMYGYAERVLGQALQGRRDMALVATKVWASSPEEGRHQIDQALTFFNGYVDLYQIHNLLNWQRDTPQGLKPRSFSHCYVVDFLRKRSIATTQREIVVGEQYVKEAHPS